jgi:hypothetical protein
MDDLRKMLLRGMKEAHHFFESMTNARSIINYYTSGPFLHLNDVTAAKRYYHEWQKKHGTEQRWAIFEKNIRLSSINLE